MGIAALIAGALVSAKASLGDLLVDVSHVGASGTLNDDAEPTAPSAAVTRQCLVEYKERTYQRPDRVIVSAARLTFVEPVAVRFDDVFTLPGGKTAPVVAIDGVVSAEAGSGLTFATFVDLGALA